MVNFLLIGAGVKEIHIVENTKQAIPRSTGPKGTVINITIFNNNKKQIHCTVDKTERERERVDNH